MADSLRFADFVFDRADRILERGGQRVALAPKTAEMLALLLAEPGALVTKNALRDTLWPSGFVEDGNLSQTVYVLRKALDPIGDGRAFIETIPRRGYRFAAPLVSFAAPAPPRPRTFGWHAAVLVVFATLALAVGPAAGARHAATALTGDAARAYALGRFYWGKRSESGLRASITEFGRVVALAPKSPLGYDGLADAYVMVADYEISAIAPVKQAYAVAERYARVALAHDPHSGEALSTLGSLALDRDHDLARAQKLFGQALALAPNDPNAHEFSGVVRMYLGDVAGAVTHLRRASELDPLSVPILTWYGMALYFDARYDDARTVLRDALALDPTRNDARYHLILVDERLARVDEARALVRELALSPHKRGESQILAALLDLRSHARPAAAIAAVRTPAGADPYSIAALDVALGRRDAALQRITAALRDPGERASRRMLAVDPRFSDLRADPRFQSLTAG